ncbi:MAG: penicillin acylase family protein [Vicinamibacterales bacterium]
MRYRVPAVVAAFVVLLSGGHCSIDAARPLAERVTIVRDTYGVPHIQAESEEAAGYGLGYAQAEDHIEFLARNVVEARGEAARFFGPALLDNDLAVRRMANLEESRRHLKDLDGTYRKVLEAFAAGVTRYVHKHRAELPAWVPREFTAADFVAVPRAGAASGASSAALVRALQTKYATTTSAGVSAHWAVEPASEGQGDDAGSNAFALGGNRTTSGRAILLGNPHLSWGSLYWEAHVIVPGRLNFYGSTLAGLPWLRAGFNEHLGYVQTNNRPDLADIFALPLEPARPDRYRYDGKSWPIVSQDVTADVLQSDGTLRTERRSYLDSHLGPIVYRSATHAFAYRSSALDAWRFFEGFWRLSHARNIGEYRKVLEKRFLPTSNFTYADAAGNILYVWNARLPRRPRDGTDYSLDVPAEPRYVWRRLHEIRDLPQLLNPPGGYIQNANNPPWYVSRLDPLDPSRFPEYVERGEMALRPQLAVALLGTKDKFSVDDVRELKYSNRLLLVERVKGDLMRALAAVPEPSPDLVEAREILAAWDDSSKAESVGGILFQRFWETYRAAAKQPFAQPWDERRPFDTPAGLADPALAVEHLEEAVSWARKTYGTARVKWGDVNRFRFGPVDIPGDGASNLLGAYRIMSFDATGDGRCRVAGRLSDKDEFLGTGDAWVLLVHFDKPLRAFSILVYGQSSRPGSPHSSDQIEMFAAHKLRPVYFRPAEIAAHTERSYRP